jgi:hypothetical protein
MEASAMSPETNTTRPSARTLANQLNAQKSTGPRTAEGKARSRTNALKHGLCAKVIEIEGENSAVLDGREVGWQIELNPFDREVQGYLVHLAVRQTGRLDRLDTIYDTKVAKFARDAHKSLKEARMREVEELTPMIETRCDVAIRRLRLIPEGCQLLIEQWECMRVTLAAPSSFDKQDQSWCNLLMGRFRVVKGQVASPVGLAEQAIRLHRVMVAKLKLNEFPRPDWQPDRYYSVGSHEADKENVVVLGEDAEKYRLWLEIMVETEIATLRETKAKLEIDDAIVLAEHSYQVRFDASDEGKLIHRYEIDTQRTIFRCIKEIQILNKLEVTNSQVSLDKEFEAHRPAPRTDSPPARNEAKPAAPDNIFTSLTDAPNRDSSFIPIHMIPETRPKHQP